MTNVYQLKRELLEAHAAIDIENADFNTACACNLDGVAVPIGSGSSMALFHMRT
jgi:hypothetical protein